MTRGFFACTRALVFAGRIAFSQAPAKSAVQYTARHIYVGAVDSKGVAVTGLSADDFIVREDNVAREVLKAEPATEAMDIILLVDDSEASTPAIQFIRDGLTTFVTKLQGKGDIGIVTIGERPTVVLTRTPDLDAMKKGIGRIFQRAGTGSYLMEGIEDVSAGLKAREAKRPIIVAVVMEDDVEFSSSHANRVLDKVAASGAQLHIVSVGSPATPSSEEMRQRQTVIAEGPLQSGGLREHVLAESALADRLALVADELINQYLVTYNRPETLIPPEKLQVSIKRPGVTAHARTRAPQK
jgi:hypothetical protein